MGRNAGPIAIGKVVAAAVSALWFFVAAHLLSLRDFADLVLLLAVSALARAVADFGYPIALSNWASQQDNDADLGLVVVITHQIPLAIVSGLVTIGAYWVAATPHSIAPPLLLAPSMVATPIYSSVYVWARAKRSPTFEALNEPLSRIGVLCAGTILLTHGHGLDAAVAILSVADVVSTIAGLVTFRRVRARSRVSAVPERNRDVAGSLSFRAVLPIGGVVLVGALYFRIDTWLLALLQKPAAVAAYGAAYEVFEGLVLPAIALAATVIPTLHRLPIPRRRRSLIEHVLLAMGITAAGSIICIIGAHPLVTLLFGQKLHDADRPLRILCAAAIPVAGGLVMAPVIAVERRRLMLLLTSVALIVNLGLNAMVIPQWGADGAAAATGVCELLLFVALGFSTSRSPALLASGLTESGNIDSVARPHGAS